MHSSCPSTEPTTRAGATVLLRLDSGWVYRRAAAALLVLGCGVTASLVARGDYQQGVMGVIVFWSLPIYASGQLAVAAVLVRYHWHGFVLVSADQYGIRGVRPIGLWWRSRPLRIRCAVGVVPTLEYPVTRTSTSVAVRCGHELIDLRVGAGALEPDFDTKFVGRSVAWAQAHRSGFPTDEHL